MLWLITAVATDGLVPQPHLLKEIEGEPAPPHWPVTRIGFDREALARVKVGLERVVGSSTGTGRLAQVPGITAAGKTGTAQVSQGEPHAWFVGYAPADHPRLSFVIFLEQGGKGGEQAALVARDLLVYLRELEYL
jgi:peptidoglycan glycosyltransferase